MHGWTGCETLKPFGENGTKMSSSCGGDYFCGSREEFVEYKGEMPRKVGGHWCLKEGEGSVKLYDVLSRSSGRISSHTKKTPAPTRSCTAPVAASTWYGKRVKRSW